MRELCWKPQLPGLGDCIYGVQWVLLRCMIREQGITAGHTVWITLRPQGTLPFVQNTESGDEFTVPPGHQQNLMYHWLASTCLPAHDGKNMGRDSGLGLNSSSDNCWLNFLRLRFLVYLFIHSVCQTFWQAWGSSGQQKEAQCQPPWSQSNEGNTHWVKIHKHYTKTEGAAPGKEHSPWNKTSSKSHFPTC